MPEKILSIKKMTASKKLLSALGIIAGVMLAVLLAYIFGWLEPVAMRYYNGLYRMRGTIPARQDVVIVYVGSEFRKKYRETNAPVSRRHFALLTEKLVEYGASIIAFDMLFIKPDWDPEGDTALAAAFDTCWDGGGVPIVAGNIDPDAGAVLPIEAYSEAETGLINLQHDRDQVVRRLIPLNLRIDHENPGALIVLPSLAVLTVAYRENLDPAKDIALGTEADGYAFRIGDRLIRESEMLINFTGGKYNFNYLEATRVIDGTEKTGLLKNAIVLVADTSAESQDFYPIPIMQPARMYDAEMDEAFKDLSGRAGASAMPGVEIHANAIQSLLDHSWIRPASAGTVVLVLILVGLAAGILFFLPKVPAWLTTVIVVVMLAAEVLVSRQLFFSYRWFDMVPVLLVTVLMFAGGIVYKNVILASANRKVAGIFGQYVSPQIVQKLLAEGGDISMKGKTQDVTVLFSDIRGFTTISERLTPEEIGVLLNVYFDRMIKVVFRNDGTLDKLMGDAVMSFFGDPIYYPDHPVKACRAALAMEQELEAMHANPPVPGMELVNIGIGLNSGVVTVGDLGSFEYRDYTVIGDNVNLGSRVEGQNKDYGTRILITEFTYASVRDHFECRKIDAVRVKGKKKPVVLYELIAEKGKADPARLERCRKFETALEQYMQRGFAEAKAVFEALAAEGDGPSKTFIERCDEYLSAPPPADWDGSYTATHK